MATLARKSATAVLLLAAQSRAARLTSQRLSSSDLDNDESASHDASLGNITSSSKIDVLFSGMQCKTNTNLGLTFDTVAKCAAAAAADASCTGSTFMYPVGGLWEKWGCRCCHSTSVSSEHSSWNMYKIPAASGAADPWPAQDTAACGQETKQKSMYGYPAYSPSLVTQPATEIRSTVVFNAFVEAPWIGTGKLNGGIFASHVVRTPAGPGGYFGPQIVLGVGQVLFSMWDADRWDKSQGHSSRTPQASDKLVWPLNLANCKRNCQDCGLASLKPLRDLGLTTGTKCVLPHAALSEPGSFSFRLWRKAESYTINTKDYGGFASAHNDFGEVDREVTGSRWVLDLTNDATGATTEVGDLLFEGGSGISALTMFDELIGCVNCNDLYHSNTRLGPFLHAEDGTVREPTSMEALINGPSSCLQYQATGDKTKSSLTFAAGPGAVKNFEMGPRYAVW